MGHNRTGRLPKSESWKRVVQALVDGDEAALARTTLLASERHLRALANDEVVAHAVWVLGALAEAARHDDFSDRLNAIGIGSDVTSALALISRVGEHMR